MVELGKGSLAKVLPSFGSPSKEAQQHKVVEKEANANKGVATDATKPLAVPQDPPKEKEVPSTMEVVLATLPLPAKGDLKSKTQDFQRQYSPNYQGSTKRENCNK